MESFAPAFILLLPSAPLVLVYVVGAIFALVKLRTWPKAATFALIGFLGDLVAQLMHAGSLLMTLPAYRGTLTIAELGSRLAAINLLATVLTVAATVMLLIAIFTDRETK